MNTLEEVSVALPETAAPSSVRSALRRRLTVTLLGAFVLLGGAVGFHLFRRPTEASVASPPRATVERDTVVFAAHAPQFDYVKLAVASEQPALAPPPAPARVAVDDTRAAPVVAPLSGRVEEVKVQLGQRVRAGERLVAIRSASLPELRRELDIARSTLAARSKALDRVRDLVAVRALPEKELALAEQERAEAAIALEAAARKQRSYRISPGDGDSLYWLTAPRAGTVVNRQAMVGMEVGPDQSDPLVTIADLNAVLVIADLPEREAAEVSLGSKALIYPAAGNRPIDGTVAHVSEIVDPVRRTVAVRIRASNPDNRLRPNAFATVAFQATSQQRVLVPSEAVVQDDQQAVLFLHHKRPDGGSQFARRQVRLGRSTGGHTEILEGLSGGETYVARGALLLLNAIELGS